MQLKAGDSFKILPNWVDSVEQIHIQSKRTGWTYMIQTTLGNVPQDSTHGRPTHYRKEGKFLYFYPTADKQYNVRVYVTKRMRI